MSSNKYGYIADTGPEQAFRSNTGVFNPADINELIAEDKWTDFGQLELIETQSVSGSSAIDFKNLQESIYNVHFVTMPTMETTSTGHPQASKMQLRFSNDGGSTFESGASDYQWVNKYVNRSDGEGVSKDSADSSIEWTPRCNSGEPTSAYMYIHNLGDATKYKFTSSHTTLNVDQGEFFFGGGFYMKAESINAIRFYNDYAMTGSLSLYGIRFTS